MLKANIARDTYPDLKEREAFQQAIVQQGFVKDYELNMKRRDGGKLSVLVTANAVRDDKGTVVAYRGIMHDVTQRKRLESQLHQSSKLAAIGELAAGVAHEINNPIAAIDVQSGVLRDIIEDERDKLNDTLAAGLEEYLDTVQEQVQRCLSVTNTLLSFARRDREEYQDFGINDLLKRTVTLVTSLADKKAGVEMILDDRLPLFRGEPNRLQQVFVNLLSNAIKALGEKGSITIVTRLDDAGDICIDFRDSGCGMPKEIKHRIFDPFFTTRSEGKGTGLGLSISYYIIKEMNGAIDVDSSPGQGTTFTVTLPGKVSGKEPETRNP